MSTFQPVLVRMIGLGAALALLAGCGGTPPSGGSSSPESSASMSAGITNSPTPTGSASPVCAASAAYSSALSKFKDTLTPNATLAQVQSARDDVLKAFDELVKAAGNEAQARVDAVVKAEQDFTAAVNAIPDDATLGQKLGLLRDDAAKVQAAVAALVAEVQC